MNIVKKLENKIKMMDTSCWQQIFIYSVIFGFGISETYVIIKLFSITNQCSQGIITLDVYIAQWDLLYLFAIALMCYMIVMAFILYFWMDSLQEENKNENEAN